MNGKQWGGLVLYSQPLASLPITVLISLWDHPSPSVSGWVELAPPPGPEPSQSDHHISIAMEICSGMGSWLNLDQEKSAGESLRKEVLCPTPVGSPGSYPVRAGLLHQSFHWSPWLLILHTDQSFQAVLFSIAFTLFKNSWAPTIKFLASNASYSYSTTCIKFTFPCTFLSSRL